MPFIGQPHHKNNSSSSWILDKTIPQNPEKKQVKKDILKNLYPSFEGRERVLDVFESKIFPTKIEGTVFQTRSLIILISKY